MNGPHANPDPQVSELAAGHPRRQPGPARIALVVAGLALIALAAIVALKAPTFSPGAAPGGPAPLTTTSGTSVIYTAQVIRPGVPAPDFALRALDGQRVRLSDYAGHPVLVNFWASWCLPCRDEMPVLEQAYAAGRIDVLGVDVLNLDDEPAARAFVQAEGATFPILFDEEGAVQRAYSVRGMPTSVLVGGNGQVVVLHIGQLTAEKLDEYLAQLKP